MRKQLLFILAALMLSWSASAQMVLEFNTNLSEGKTITLPLYGDVNVTVNWGDANSEAYTTEGNQEHTYAAEGTYTVSITGSLTQFGNGWDETLIMDKLVKVTSFGNIGLTSLSGAFYNATNLEELPSELPSSVNSLEAMLCGATIFNGDIGNWNVSNVTDMHGMFWNAAAFNQNISSWNVSNVTKMRTMFYEAAKFNQDISGWNVSNVTNMHGMFRYATAFNQNINTKIINLGEPNQYVAWNVSKVTDMVGMFLEAMAFNGDISSWNVSNVTDMWGMFYDATAFNQNIGEWNVSKVNRMSDMFNGAKAFNQNIGGWDVTSVTKMTTMFYGVTLSTSNYNNLLIGWAGKIVKNNVVFGAGNSQYSLGAAANARAVLAGTYNWTITDGGVLNVLTVLTIAPSEITATTATSGGDIVYDGGSPVTARGVVWATSANPTIESNTGITADGDGMGTFTSSITGLIENTSYYVRAYATNANGTEYGDNIEFTTKKATFTVTFIVTDNSVPFTGASISINEQTLTSNAEGIATIELKNGVYPYSVTASNHPAHEGSITVNEAAVVEDVLFLHVGVKSNSLVNIGLYPNPFSNEIRIANAIDAKRIVITTVTGELVLNQPAMQVVETNLSSGIYLITIIANDGSKVIRKMIRE